MELYHNTSFACSRLITRSYSTSFSMAIYTLHKRLRNPICGIYGFVRYADEIVDTFYDHNQHKMLAEFRQQTYQAIEEKISMNPVLHTFQLVVHKYQIPMDLIDAFLKSMEMDLYLSRYGSEILDEYIYGSAEVVGLMCMKVFSEGNDELYNQLIDPARSLGSAFQKVNFLRDIQSDYHERGRIYFPGVDWKTFTNIEKKQIENDIHEDFKAAFKGILKLPKTARYGVYLAYIYYISLFRKIQKLPASRIMHERIRIPNNKKWALLAETYLKSSLNFI